MARQTCKSVRWSKWAAALAALVLLCGCASLPPTASVAIPKLAPGTARAWFYRLDEPYNGMARPYVRMNGGIVGVSELGGAFYRDVPPGEYFVTADTYGIDVNQFPHIYLSPGETAYFQILSSRYWASGSASSNWTRPTFYVWVMPPAIAVPAIAGSPFYPGGG
jgi:hypothetical protein